MSLPMIEIEHVSKEYRLGSFGGRTLNAEIQSKIARLRGKEDPNSIIGSKQHVTNERFLALDDVSFSVDAGEAVGIIGHNGAGKSTLLKLISRVTAPTLGEIRLRGRVASMLEVGTGFHPELTGRENIYLNGAILGMTRTEIDKKFDQIVEFAEMEQFIDTPVKRFSSGMYVKLAFSVAAHLDSEIMIMDEVLAVGDAKFQSKCLGKMGDEASTNNRTILYVSHNMSTIRRLCSRVVVLDHGHLVFDGDVESGIERYLGLAEQFQPVRDFREAKRNGFYGHALHINTVEILDSAEGKVTDSVTFRVDFECRKDLENVHARAEIRAKENYTIGTAPSDVLFERLEKGKNYSCVLNVSLPDLMPGRFGMVLLFYSENEFANTTTLDRAENAVTFEVSEEKILRWVTRDRGYIKFPQMQMLEYSEEQGITT